MSQPSLTVNDDARVAALRALPHGPEFRFLDRILQIEPGRRGTGEYRVRGDELFLKGHFPGDPLFPGVLLVEAAAQLAGAVAQSDPSLKPLPDLRLTGLRAVKILGTARPGETVILEANVSGRLGNLIQASAKASVQQRLVLTAELTFSGTTGEVNAAMPRLEKAT